jgi:diguanylate cyclase (GGDEF)-like protein
MKKAPASLRLQTLLLVVVTSVAIISGLILMSLLLFQQSFLNLESEAVRQQTRLAVSLLQKEQEKLVRFVQDWGPWDDTYDFVLEPSSAYIENNLAEATFIDQGFNLFLVVDAERNVVFYRQFHLERREWVSYPSSSFLQEILKHPYLAERSENVAPLQGIVRTPEGFWLVAAFPVLRSDFSGPRAGTLVVARQITDSFRRALAEESGLQLTFEDLPVAAQPVSLEQSMSIQVQPLDGEWVRGSAVFQDIYLRPAFRIAVQMERTIFHQGQQAISFFVVTLMLSGAVYGLVVSQGVKRLAIQPLVRLVERLQHIRETEDLSMRVPEEGHNEIALLARHINATLEALEHSAERIRKDQDRLNHQARHDPLTGFPNRLYFFERLQQVVQRVQHDPEKHSVLIFLDLDGFKMVNDTYDHSVGDQVLCVFAERLKRSLRGGDFIARLGGDEFAILLEDTASLDEAIHIAERLIQVTRQPFDLGGRQVFLSMSAGIAVVSPHQRGEEILRNADMAMYAAKGRGKSRVMVFDEEMHQQLRDQIDLANDLRTALEEDQFCLTYQPVVRLLDGRITGVEALLRWKHPERGLLLPAAFLSVAQSHGLMPLLDRVVVEKSLAQLRAWDAEGLPPVHLALNFSALSLQEANFVDWLGDVLREKRIPPERLEVEILETDLASNFSHFMQSLERLKQLGVRLCIDDFGTGYSTLWALKQMPVDTLKIDRQFIQGLPLDRDNAAIVQAMIAAAHSLEMETIAEGVENEEEYRFLLENGCDRAQGFLFARPQFPGQIARMLKQGKWKPSLLKEFPKN